MNTILNAIMQRIQKYWLLITAIILLAITLLSLWPLSKLPSVPGSDKTHHFIAYAALMLPTALRLSVSTKRYWVIVVFFIGYSGMIELLQPLVNRYGEWLDLLANSGGVLLGIVLGTVWQEVVNRRLR